MDVVTAQRFTVSQMRREMAGACNADMKYSERGEAKEITPTRYKGYMTTGGFDEVVYFSADDHGSFSYDIGR